MRFRIFVRENRFALLLMALTCIGVTVSGVAFEQAPLRMLPLYVSMVISLMHTRAIRYAHLLGSINVIAYGLVNIYYGLYAAALSCFFFSCPVQLITFLRWQKNKSGSSTTFRKLSLAWRVSLAVALLGVWAGVVLVLRMIGSAYSFVDSTATLLELSVSTLTMLAFIEHAPLRIVSGVLNVGLSVIIFLDSPDYATYLIYNLYSLICVTIGTFSVMKLYKEQKAARIAAEGECHENSMG